MPPATDSRAPDHLAKRVLRGDRRAVARLISLIESESVEGAVALSLLYHATGRSHVVGVTGPPGAGKSTLVNRLGLEAIRRGRRVAVLALDPSSPFTGGALLGDRVRMHGLSEDPNAYVRSMASRGARGGLARAARDAVRVLEAAGSDLVLVETVGAGQAEVDVADLAQTTVVVAVPELGDEIQALKAGLYEAADVFALNKSDLPGAEQAAAALEISAERTSHGWRPPIVRCAATTGDGVSDLLDAIDRHREHLASDGRWSVRQLSVARAEIVEACRDCLFEVLLERLGRAEVDSAAARVAGREVDARSAARSLVERALGARSPQNPDTQPSDERERVIE